MQPVKFQHPHVVAVAAAGMAADVKPGTAADGCGDRERRRSSSLEVDTWHIREGRRTAVGTDTRVGEHEAWVVLGPGFPPWVGEELEAARIGSFLLS